MSWIWCICSLQILCTLMIFNDVFTLYKYVLNQFESVCGREVDDGLVSRKRCCCNDKNRDLRVVKWQMPIASKEVSVPVSFASCIRSAYGLLILTVSPPSTSPPSVQASRPLAFALLCRTLKGVAGLILDDTCTWRRPDIWLLFVYFVSRHIDAHWAYCSCCFFSSWFGLSDPPQRSAETPRRDGAARVNSEK